MLVVSWQKKIYSLVVNKISEKGYVSIFPNIFSSKSTKKYSINSKYNVCTILFSLPDLDMKIILIRLVSHWLGI